MDCTALVADNTELAAADMAERRVRLSSAPSTVQIEVTNKCNLSCATCARNYWDASINREGDVSLDVIDRLEPFLKRASTIVPFGYGESLISQTFPEVMRRLREINSSSQIMLFTNGLSINRQRLAAVMDYGVNTLYFSVDGADEESFRRARGGGSFARLTENIALVRELKRQRGSAAPTLSVSFTATAANLEQLPSLVRYCADNGITSLTVSIARIFEAAQRDMSLLSSESTMLRAEEIFAQASEIGRVAQVDVVTPRVRGPGVPCLQPFNTVFVKWDGEVRLCCASAIVSAPPMYVVAGNLFENAIEEIWNNAVSQKVRLGLLDPSGESLDPVCRSCPMNQMSMENLCKYENLGRRRLKSGHADG